MEAVNKWRLMMRLFQRRINLFITASVLAAIVVGLGSYYAAGRTNQDMTLGSVGETCISTNDQPPENLTGEDLRLWRNTGDLLRRKLIEVRVEHHGELFEIPGVHAIGSGKNALQVLVDPEASSKDKARIPRDLEGCAVQVIEEPRFRFRSGSVDFEGQPASYFTVL